jgi:hypothetical protein
MEAAKGGRAGVRATTLSVVVVTAALALTGCETTAEKSAQLERTAHHAHLAERGLSITKQSADVRVLGAVLVHGAEGAAVVVTLRNDTAHAYKDVPIAITVKDAHGGTIFQNNAPEATWVDDQVPAAGDPASVSAIAGEPPIASGPVPRIEVAEVHRSEESGTATAAGTVRNRSNVAQQSLVVYVIARGAGGVVAAGRAILPEVAPSATVPFQAFLVGAPHGAPPQAGAPATTLG